MKVTNHHSSSSIDLEKCVATAENRFDLVLIAAARVRELVRNRKRGAGHARNEVVDALRELEHGKIGREYLKKVR